MKYMGSKARFAKDILPIILANRGPDQWYVEPFVGGGNIIDKVPGKRLGNDINCYVIDLLEELSTGWIPPYLTRAEYNDIRDYPHVALPKIVGWAGIGCSYSGKWFGGYAGKVKTKVGTIRDYIQEAINNAIAQSPGLAGTEFKCGPYYDFTIPPNSIIYCDPPYDDTTSYNIPFDTESFWSWCDQQIMNGHQVFVSEYKAPVGWRMVWQKAAASSLSANGKHGGNKMSIEKLFTK